MSCLPWADRHDALPEEVRQAMALGADIVLLDVRTHAEYAARHIPGALLIPVHELAARAGELDPGRNWVVVCEHGIRSRAAMCHLVEIGFPSVCSMAGGMAHWDGPEEAGPPRHA